MKRLALLLSLAITGAHADSRALHERLLVLDSHMDTPRQLSRPSWSILQRHGPEDLSQVDLPRMREGGLDGGFWAVYTPQGNLDEAGMARASDQGLATLARIRDMLARNPDDFALALTPEDAPRIAAEGKRVVYISMENAEPLASDPRLLNTYQRQGLRMLGLVHSANNHVADSATAIPQWHGLSPVGRELVQRANCLGVLLDASHASDQVFDQLLAQSRAPIIVSHSSSRAINPHPRNLDDARMRRLAESGGVIQVNTYGGYLIPQPPNPQREKALKPLFERLRLMPALQPAAFAELSAQIREVQQRYPSPQATFADFMRHLLHALEQVGPLHVGIGADWDGGGGVQGLEDVSQLPKITEALLQAGYSEADIGHIWSGNLLRVLGAAQARGRQLQAEGQCGEE
ncbi:membrane dipeptidase [Pseudomonas sp. WS 5106]|uniref:Membrane dipeptidase n=1 Tax=Pseudomonas cremoris TaxID=2724178 RepID=A0A7X1DZ04_9PSED|nr:membrane dipeptidase [Pseudomonas cremoris]MBC2406972.1 membrane dipeptidase [Pseudomonas cremoris]